MTSLLTQPGPEALARLSAGCRLCRKRITAGHHYIVRVPGIGWVHAECAHAHRRCLEENAEDVS